LDRPTGPAAAGVQPPTTGVEVLDELIDGLRISDNLVVVATADEPLDRLVAAFVAANRVVRPVVAVRTDGAIASPPTEEPPAGQLEALDLRGAAAAAAVSTALRDVDERLGAGAAYVVDSLSGLAAAIDVDAALELFLATCPYLYERRSVALWPVRADRLPAALLARLHAITQVVLEVTEVPDGWQVEVRQAAGRADATVGRRIVLAATPTALTPAGPVTSGRERLGAMVRAQRTTRGLSQAELARQIGISPSALSQAERGVRGLSGESLMRVWEALDVPFGPADTRLRGYHLARRGAQPPARERDGATIRTLVDTPELGSVHHVTLAPGAASREPLFASKGAEVVVVLTGVVDLAVGGHPETLQAGDAVVVTEATVGGWANPGDQAAELIWSVHGRGAARA
jgi:transcriptional regulator with XRE-family HTH domain